MRLDPDLRERHAAAVGLPLADRVPVLVDGDALARGRHHGEHRFAGGRIVRGDRHHLRAARAGAKALLAVETIAAVARRRCDSRVSSGFTALPHHQRCSTVPRR